MTAPVLPAVRAAGPTAVLAFLLFFVALAVHGDEAGALARSVPGVASNALALVSAALVLLGLVHLAATRPVLHSSGGRFAVALAGVGTVLLCGSAWSQLVVLPALAVEAPRVANEGSTLITAGYVASFLLAGIGWLLVGLRLRDDAAAGRGAVRLLLVGSVLMVAPLPTRWVVLAVAVTLLASARRAPAPAPGTVPAAA